MHRHITSASGLAVATLAVLLTGCGGGSPTGQSKQTPSAEKEIKSGKGRVATDEIPPPPVRQ